MSFRQAVIQLGSWTVKAGLWEQTFLPNFELPACTRVSAPADGGDAATRQFGEHFADGTYPIVGGRLTNATELEHLLRYVLLTGLQLAEPIGDVAVVLIIPAFWSRTTRLAVLRVMLDGIGVGGVYFSEAPQAAAFGCALSTALVVDMGHSVTEVAAIVDGEPLPGAYECLSVGGHTVDRMIADFFQADADFQQSARQTGQGAVDLMAAARALKESPDAWSNNSGSTATSPTAAASFKCGDTELRIGPNLGRVLESFVSDTDLLEAIGSVLRRSDADKRTQLLDHIVLTGPTTRLPLRPLLETQLRARLAVSEYCGEAQARTLRFRTVPEYYPDLWQRATPLAAWFGGGVTAKCVLSDSKNYYTREDLLQHGSRIFINKPL